MVAPVVPVAPVAKTISWAAEVAEALPQYKGGDTAPAGTYFCTRTVALWQQQAEGPLPTTEVFVHIEPTGKASFADVATLINATTMHEGYGTSFTAASFGVYEVKVAIA